MHLSPVVAMAAAIAACSAVPDAAPVSKIDGTQWRVVAVNGRPAPAVGDYAIRFGTDGRIGARFGCNMMGGRYRLAGDVLTVSDLAGTLMGCPEPAASLERDGAAVLGQPMRMAFSSNERMYLSSAAGSISLDPIP